MEGFKRLVNDCYDDRKELMTKIDELERTKCTDRSVISCLENQLHQMKLKQFLHRRDSVIGSSVSLMDLGKSNQAEVLLIQLERERTKLVEKDEEIKKLNKQIKQMVDQFKKELMEKDNKIRVLHNELVNLKGQIRVAIRVRDYEKKGNGFIIMGNNEVRFEHNSQSNVFCFEHLFSPSYDQEKVFEEISELILCVLHGYNVCLIAYGPTGSGKTYTMRGEGIENCSEGVIPRAIRFLLDTSKSQMAVIDWKFRFSASYLEVYNEEVFDLLDKRRKCEVRLSSAGSSSNVAGLKRLPVNSFEDVEIIMSLADSYRSTASTACNSHSSRSHAIFQIHVEGINSTTGQIVKCCLNLVDLAGSERVKESGAIGERFTELTNINQSLTILKKCIRAQMTQMSHVPYRESKLTILLRAYLGAGSSKTMFIAHINPKDAVETKRTLEFTADLRSTNIGRAAIQTKS